MTFARFCLSSRDLEVAKSLCTGERLRLSRAIQIARIIKKIMVFMSFHRSRVHCEPQQLNYVKGGMNAPNKIIRQEKSNSPILTPEFFHTGNIRSVVKKSINM